MQSVAVALLVAATAGGVVPAAASVTAATRLGAELTPGQEVPAQTVEVPTAAGRFAATLTKTKKGYRLSWRLTFEQLSGKATSGYIHRGKRGKHGAAYFHLCSPCVSGAHGSAYASPSEVSLMKAGLMYVNVRTAKNPAGEIRGQIAVG